MMTTTDTSAEAVERLADWHDDRARDYDADNPRAETHRVTAATLRALLAERDELAAKIVGYRHNDWSAAVLSALLARAEEAEAAVQTCRSFVAARGTALGCARARAEDAEAERDEAIQRGNDWCDQARKLRDERDRLREALQSVLDACDQGRMVERGAGGMTLEAQIRRSVYNNVPAWPIEEARAALKELDHD
jgi:hypothetical protein